ncbi:hypothetical protein HMPREF9711_01019 [Myroides odoratimimus CCUG 3837]|uniref:Crp/Fnr family transcriptional regulator n=1 Tax=Myroides odoratimimus TaxID=76832 RepID=UPI000280A44B|nr:Crp/Fnr family transcriptional regulator [Myroides odoratimimus]EKB05640.1 hypothetical protein HMPREF9711_01019 [Myroides odoratimimus CCUG 3837]
MVIQNILTNLQEQGVSLDNKELEALTNVFSTIHLKKGELFLAQNQPCNRLGILTEGSLYAYSILEDGTEKIHGFYYPGDQCIVFNYKSYHKDEHSTMYIKCYEPCTLYTIVLSEVKALYPYFPFFQLIEQAIAKHNIKTAIKKIEILQNESNTEKIKAFQRYFPRVFTFFPYSYIASYLGIHRNTFNRVLKKM